jgi:hypothetical protein
MFEDSPVTKGPISPVPANKTDDNPAVVRKPPPTTEENPTQRTAAKQAISPEITPPTLEEKVTQSTSAKTGGNSRLPGMFEDSSVTKRPISPVPANETDDNQAVARKPPPTTEENPTQRTAAKQAISPEITPPPQEEKATQSASAKTGGNSRLPSMFEDSPVTKGPISPVPANKTDDNQAVARNPPPTTEEKPTQRTAAKKVDNSTLPSIFPDSSVTNQEGEKPANSPMPKDSGGPYHSLEDLQQKKVEGIDNSCREQFLSPEDFEKQFKMAKEEFAKLPKWKRDKTKRAAKLF